MRWGTLYLSFLFWSKSLVSVVAITLGFLGRRFVYIMKFSGVNLWMSSAARSPLILRFLHHLTALMHLPTYRAVFGQSSSW